MYQASFVMKGIAAAFLAAMTIVAAPIPIDTRPTASTVAVLALSGSIVGESLVPDYRPRREPVKQPSKLNLFNRMFGNRNRPKKGSVSDKMSSDGAVATAEETISESVQSPAPRQPLIDLKVENDGESPSEMAVADSEIQEVEKDQLIVDEGVERLVEPYLSNFLDEYGDRILAAKNKKELRALILDGASRDESVLKFEKLSQNAFCRNLLGM